MATNTNGVQPQKLSKDDVVFSEANEEQLTSVWTLNAAAWAGDLSIEKHIERERILSQQPASGKLWKTWVLALKDDPSTVVASVETFEKTVLIGKDGKCSSAKGYGVASVFTNPTYRGNRLANVLMEKLQQWLDSEADGFVSVLYSDIGANFYTRLGWIPASTRTVRLETDPRLWDPEHPHLRPSLPKFTFLKEGEKLQELCSMDISVITTELADASTDGEAHFAFAPSYEAFLWHIKREDLNGEMIHGRWKTRLRGAVAESGRAWIIWHFDEIDHKLKVQRLVVLDKHEKERNIQELAVLIWFCQVVGKWSAFMTTTIWNPSEEVMKAIDILKSGYDQMQIKVEDREGSIPCARQQFGDTSESLNWLANEYYAWC